jgi:hypothetical protein
MPTSRATPLPLVPVGPCHQLLPGPASSGALITVGAAALALLGVGDLAGGWGLGTLVL